MGESGFTQLLHGFFNLRQTVCELFFLETDQLFKTIANGSLVVA
jgi:hypothetical protein